MMTIGMMIMKLRMKQTKEKSENMGSVALETFREVTIRLVDRQAFATHQLISTLSSQPVDNVSMLRVLLVGQGAMLLALSALLHENDEVEIPQAFRDAFEDMGE